MSTTAGLVYGSWTATALAATSVGATSYTTAASFTAISNNGYVATEVSVKCLYGATTTAGLIVAILRETDSTPDYEEYASGEDDLPYAFTMAWKVSDTRRRTITIPGDVGTFKVVVYNPNATSATVTVMYRQATVVGA